MRIALRLAYDGTDFHGWARQPNLRSVQEVLESALALLLRSDDRIATVCAGRTDAGVHARDQWVHFDVTPEMWSAVADRIEHRLRAVLPDDVRVLEVREVSDDFDARFSPLWRRYAYRICDDPTGVDPLCRRDVLVWHRPLDVAAMHAAAQPLVGQHDFAAYCKQREGATTIRGLQRLDVTRQDDGIVRADLVADAFCHSMVRSLMGALIAVGDGRKPVDWPAEMLASESRDGSVAVVPPHGLVLEEVAYPDAAELAARAEQTRNWRTLDAGGVEG